jgi:mannose-6-phosphate isomerase-like protein (cupin superfamily)
MTGCHCAEKLGAMTRSHLTQRPGPEHSRRGWQYILPCLPEDARALARQLAASGPAKRECPGCAEHRYLDWLVAKPWGDELRVYDDAFLDAWLLRLEAGLRTSTHGHPRKDTVLLCLRGRGKVTAGNGRSVPIERGSMLHIDQGAVHCTQAETELLLIEIETPRDKFDLVRVKDDNGRTGRPYEPTSRADKRLGPLAEVADGPSRARLRERCPGGLHRFAIEPGHRLGSRGDLLFAIDLDSESALRRQLSVIGPRTHDAPVGSHLYMTVRNADEEDSR